MKNWAGNSYAYWQPRRKMLFALVCVLTLLLVFLALRAPVREDIGAMIPDSSPELHETFRALSNAPFMRMVLVELSIENGNDADALHASVNVMAEAMQEPKFSSVVTGVGDMEALHLFEWLFARWPQLFTEGDAKTFDSLLQEASIREQLTDNLRILSQPEGIAMKDLILKDPLALREPLMKKLQDLSVLPKMRLEQEHFVSPDGLHALIIAETPIQITDAGGCIALVGHIEQLMKEHLQPGVRARLVCGHLYTAANTRIIKQDLFRVFTASTIGLLIAFLLFLRRWSTLFVLVLPFFAVLFALAFTSVAFTSISGITIGFGAVLLGLTIDFGLHVYFALQDTSRPARRIIESIALPLTMCAATSIAVFSMMFFSCMPGQRQLAAYSVAGLSAALFFSLLVLPHMIRPLATNGVRLSLLRPRSSRIPLVWMFLLACCVPLAFQVSFDGSLRNVGYMPPEVIADEIAIRDTWGDIRDRALAISEGGNLEEALQRNEGMADAVRKRFPNTNMVSVTAMLPSRKRQQENLARWQTFWHEDGQMACAKSLLASQGEALGYAPEAFDSLFAWIDQPRTAFSFDDLADAGLMRWMEPLAGENSQSASVVAFLEDSEAISAFFQEDDTVPEGVRFVSDTHFNAMMNAAISHDFMFFLLLAAVSVTLFLVALFRNARRVALGLLPAASGVLMMLAVLTLLGMKVNLFNMLAAVLVIGLTADYGIFMVYRIEGRVHDGTARAVLASGFTTVAGFGALSLARHPALFSIGFTVLLGIVPALIAALIIVPLCAPAKNTISGQESTS